jgi:hypothetical protein
MPILQDLGLLPHGAEQTPITNLRGEPLKERTSAPYLQLPYDEMLFSAYRCTYMWQIRFTGQSCYMAFLDRGDHSDISTYNPQSYRPNDFKRQHD